MQTKAIEGVVENGRIRRSEDAVLEDHTRVYVIFLQPVPSVTGQVRSPRLAHREHAEEFRKQVVEIPGDA